MDTKLEKIYWPKDIVSENFSDELQNLIGLAANADCLERIFNKALHALYAQQPDGERNYGETPHIGHVRISRYHAHHIGGEPGNAVLQYSPPIDSGHMQTGIGTINLRIRTFLIGHEDDILTRDTQAVFEQLGFEHVDKMRHVNTYREDERIICFTSNMAPTVSEIYKGISHLVNEAEDACALEVMMNGAICALRGRTSFRIERHNGRGVYTLRIAGANLLAAQIDIRNGSYAFHGEVKEETRQIMNVLGLKKD